jgi:hypothetical protein
MAVSLLHNALDDESATRLTPEGLGETTRSTDYRWLRPAAPSREPLRF